MDVRVRNKKTGEFLEMSEVSFNMLKDEFELATNKKPVIKPIVLVEKTKDQLITLEVKPNDERPLLEAQYEKIFGQKPHHRMKNESIKAAVEEKKKEMVDTSTGD